MNSTTSKEIPYLAHANPEIDADIFYMTGLMAPDPYTALKIGDDLVLAVSPLEYGRAVNESKATRIVDTQSLMNAAKEFKAQGASQAGAQVLVMLRDLEVDKVEVPQDFPLQIARDLEKFSVKVETYEHRMLQERLIKDDAEVDQVRESIAITQKSLTLVETILGEASIENQMLKWQGEWLTSERVHREIEHLCLDFDAEAKHPIVAGGDQACDPHERGHGVLYADQMIIVDIFPRSKKHHYWGDLTRTFIKGKPTDEQKKLYQTVYDVQQQAISRICEGADSCKIHQEVEMAFEKQGYRTEKIGGGYQGFFHGTGHGFGLDIHEPPRLGKIQPVELKEGMLVTVEPGLYYPDPGPGGCRIEDDVLVKRGGCEVLSDFHYDWIIE